MIPDVACSAGFLGHGDDYSDRGGDHNHRLEDEEPFEFVRRCEKEGELDAPKDEMGDHLLSGDAYGRRDVVGDVKVGRPDCSYALGHGS